MKKSSPNRSKDRWQHALNAGRIDYASNIDPDDDDPGPCCGPFSIKGWEDLHRQWEQAHR
jgi:hypothetical protein